MNKDLKSTVKTQGVLFIGIMVLYLFCRSSETSLMSMAYFETEKTVLCAICFTIWGCITSILISLTIINSHHIIRNLTCFIIAIATCVQCIFIFKSAETEFNIAFSMKTYECYYNGDSNDTGLLLLILGIYLFSICLPLLFYLGDKLFLKIARAIESNKIIRQDIKDYNRRKKIEKKVHKQSIIKKTDDLFEKYNHLKAEIFSSEQKNYLKSFMLMSNTLNFGGIGDVITRQLLDSERKELMLADAKKEIMERAIYYSQLEDDEMCLRCLNTVDEAGEFYSAVLTKVSKDKAIRELAIKRKRKIGVAVSILIIAIVINGVYSYKANLAYKYAESLLQTQKYSLAINAYKKLGIFKNSKELVEFSKGQIRDWLYYVVDGTIYRSTIDGIFHESVAATKGNACIYNGKLYYDYGSSFYIQDIITGEKEEVSDYLLTSLYQTGFDGYYISDFRYSRSGIVAIFKGSSTIQYHGDMIGILLDNYYNSKHYGGGYFFYSQYILDKERNSLCKVNLPQSISINDCNIAYDNEGIYFSNEENNTGVIGENAYILGIYSLK